MHNEESCENGSSNGSCSDTRADEHVDNDLGAQGSELNPDEGLLEARRENGQNTAARDGDGDSLRGSNSLMQLADDSASGAVFIMVPKDSPREELAASGVPKVEICREVEDAAASSPKKLPLERNGSYNERCRVCHEQSEEAIVELGCSCRGELAKAHRSCIQTWFCTKGSNKCEICHQVIGCGQWNQHLEYLILEAQIVAGYVSCPVGPLAAVISCLEFGQGCISPLWVAFSILICGLLLDVLISMTLGLSALPVNIIIGILVVLGLGTAFRLALDCCFEWTLRRVVQRSQLNSNPV
ncbi:E3 ubiquitin-protein ligase [Nymphaea thermarum]|nr:E3 ubiquitin-protein ligase [Nymphaea thermarum]